MKNWFHAFNVKTVATSWGAAVLSRTLHHLDNFVLRQTGGRHTLSNWLSGLPTVMVTTTGAKSGQPRSVPLIAVPDGERLILIASNWGQKHYPAWYHNLRAHPQIEVTQAGRTMRFIAHEATGEERERCWQKAVQIYFGYSLYAQRTQGRPIPVIVLTPPSNSPGDGSSGESQSG